MDVQRADADGTPAWFRLVCMWILCFGFRVKGVQGLRKGLGFTIKGCRMCSLNFVTKGFGLHREGLAKKATLDNSTCLFLLLLACVQ